MQAARQQIATSGVRSELGGGEYSVSGVRVHAYARDGGARGWD